VISILWIVKVNEMLYTFNICKLSCAFAVLAKQRHADLFDAQIKYQKKQGRK